MKVMRVRTEGIATHKSNGSDFKVFQKLSVQIEQWVEMIEQTSISLFGCFSLKTISDVE